MARPVSEKPKEKLLSVPVTEEMADLLKVAAAREGRSVAGFIRFYGIEQQLQKHGLLDESFELTETGVAAIA
jgi:hypothetical protein